MKKEDKPMLDTEGQIKHLQSKGVQFNRITVEEATAYLQENNNYFKLRAYRKNFPKHPDGALEGQYINLDFAFLKDLSIIDMRMRYTFLQMALDIEHFAKVNLLRVIEESDEDGYTIVEEYFDSLITGDDEKGTKRHGSLMSELSRNKKNPYCGGIIEKYDGCYPVWAFIEIISFGTFIHFYGFCSDHLQNKHLKDRYYLLFTIKELRNATAHSNCLIHDMGAKDSTYKPNFSVLRALSGISKTTRDNRLKNERMRQIITLLYAYTVFVTSKGVRKHTKENLAVLVSRMYREIDYYSDNDNILATFAFFKKAVDILYNPEYT